MPPGLMELEHYSQKPYGEDCEASKDYYENVAVERARSLQQ